MKNIRYCKKNLQKILEIILTLFIFSGLIYVGVKYIPKICDHISNSRQKNQSREDGTVLKVYELDYGEEAYKITSSNYFIDFGNGGGACLEFYPDNHRTDGIGEIWFIPRDKLLKVKLIKTFLSKSDTTSFVKIK
jgi:hypothetical protein